MNKLLAFTLGGIMAAGTVGAVALSLPGNDPQISVQAEEVPENLSLDNVQNLVAKWNNTENKVDVTFTIPGVARYYDDYYQSYTYEYTEVDKVELIRSEKDKYGVEDVVLTTEKVAVGDYTMSDATAERGKTYMYKVKYYVGGSTLSWPSSSPYVQCGMFPGMVTGFAYTTNNGAYPVVVTAKAPVTYTDGSDITEPLLIEAYTSEYVYNPETYTSSQVKTVLATAENVEAGAEFSVSITEGLKDNNLNSVLFTAYSADGASNPAYCTILLGADYPGAPLNLTLVENADGTFTLAWDAPGACRGGYLEPGTTRYKVTYTKGDSYSEIQLAKDLTETTYTATVELSAPTQLNFNVYSYNDNGTSMAAKAKIVAGPAESLPFVETFNTGSGYSYSPDHIWLTTSDQVYGNTLQCGEYGYVANKQITPADGEGALAMFYYYSTDNTTKTDYITSSKINVDGEGELELSFNYYGAQGFTNVLKGQISFDGGEFTDVAVADYSKVTETKWETATGKVTVPAGATTAVLRLASSTCVTEPANPCYALFDNIKLRSGDAPLAIYPASVNNFKAEYDEDSQSITVSMTAPTKTHATLGDVNGGDLDYITRIDLYRQAGSYGDYVLVHTFEAPKPGEELTWTDEDLGTGGYYWYKAIVYVENNCDYGAFLDNSVLVGQIPGEVTGLTAQSTKGDAPIIVKWTTPAVDSFGKTLKGISEMLLERFSYTSYSWVTLKTFTEVELGTEYEYTDNDVAKDSQYQYRVTCTGSAGKNYGASVSISTKDDTPAQPKNVVATAQADGSILLTWDPVTTGVSNGYVDLEKLTYTVYRGFGNIYNDTDATLVAEGLTENKYVDNNTDFTETNVKYFVKAVCGELSGYSLGSNLVFAGNPGTLPLIENFNEPLSYTVTSNIAWLTSNSVMPSAYWGYSTSAYIEGATVSPVNNDGGLAYCYYGTWTTDEYDDNLTSVHIALKGGETPVVTFYYYAVPNYDSAVRVAVSFNNGEFTDVWSASFREATEAGWEQAVIALDAPEEASVMQVRFISHKGAYSCPVAIDNIAIFDLPVPVLEKVDNLNLAWTVEETEYATLAGYNLYQNGERANEDMLATTTTTHAVTEEANAGDYAVTALYNEGSLESAKSNTVYLSGAGIADAAVAGVKVLSRGGCIVVEGAGDQLVTIHATDGTTVHAATGDCNVALTPATYLVKVGAMPAVKLFVR